MKQVNMQQVANTICVRIANESQEVERFVTDVYNFLLDYKPSTSKRVLEHAELLDRCEQFLGNRG